MLDTPEPLGLGAGNKLHWYVQQLQRPWKAFLAVGVCLALVAASIGIGGLGFAAQLSISFLPSPALTEVYAAYENFLENNPVFVNGDIEGILMSRTDGLTVFDDSIPVSAEVLGDAVISAVNASVHDLPDGESPPPFRIRWFYTYSGTDLTGLAFQYVYPDFSAMMIAIEFDNAAEVSDAFLTAMGDAVSEVQSNYTEKATGWSVVATGRLTTTNIATTETGKGFGIVNGAGIPLIAIIFWFEVGSGILLLFPAVATGCALVVSYGVGYLLATHTSLDIPSYQADIMLFLALALAIDYSFFLLTRVQEERQRIQSLHGTSSWLGLSRMTPKMEMAVAASSMMRHSGEIVMTSGSILVVTWLALGFFPVYGLDAIGYCSAITVFLCMVLNLVLTPALLMLMADCCLGKHAGFRMCGCCRCCKPSYRESAYSAYAQKSTSPEGPSSRRGSGSHTPKSTDTKALTEGLLEHEDTPVMEYQQQTVDLRRRRGSTASHGTIASDRDGEGPQSNCYGRSARYLTKCPGKAWVPLLVIALFGGLCSFLFFVELQLAANIDFGTGAAASAYANISSSAPSFFGGGFGIIATLSPENTTTVFTDPDFFPASCMLAQTLQQRVPKIANASVSNVGFIPFLKTGCITAAEAQDMLTHPTVKNKGGYYQWACGEGTHLLNLTTLQSATTVFDPEFNPFSSESKDFVSAVRDVLEDVSSKYPALSFELYHPIVVEIDAEAFVLGRLPVVFAVMMILIFIMIAVVYRAAFVPVKLTLTLLLPIFAIYGLASAVYQFGILDWTTATALEKDGSGGISWLLPCSTAFLLIGLALDYDIFLFSRVYELRKTKLQTVPAIVEAVRVTGPVISGAGIIMALAFLGMLFNSNKFLNEFGFIMITGVLVDTFVVRTILVPAVLSTGGALNWWPMKMPDH